MKVFMLGWEFPPHISGGLGTACFGLTKGLDELGVEVCFVLPTAVAPAGSTHVTLRSPTDIVPSADAIGDATVDEYTEHIFEHVELHQVRAALQDYGTPDTFEKAIAKMIAEQRLAVKEAVPQNEAEEVKKQLEETGAIVEIK
jgi:glycogen(starch) synthase